MAFQSLYRRFRPQRFADVRGQDHVSNTLRNAVRDNKVSHAYLFSGPRGTGKTSSARILAKALNCANALDGEPCGVCTSCTEIAEGRSLDVVELDAASNRGVDAMRDLVSRSNLGTPGRWKVYIVDEVHMLTTEASNTLLKTLEEPPGHVIFVLATTEPQKVLPTIRSRTQHFEFRLLSTDVLADHLRWVCREAGLDIPDEVIQLVAKRGAGSARDALSKLDQVAAAGGIDDVGPSTDELMEALCEHDVGRALAAVAERVGAGHDPRQLAVELLERLRQAFLATVSRSLVGLPDEDLARVEAQIARLGRAAAVRAMEVLGEALVAMRDAPDPRVLLEVSLVRLCRPESDTSPAALLQRIERLERALAAGGVSQPPAQPPPPRPPVPDRKAPSHDRMAPPAVQTPSTPSPSSPAAGARLALGGVAPQPASRQAPSPVATRPPTGPPAPPPAPAPPAADTGAPFPTRDEITLAWGDTVFESLSQKAKVRVRDGRFVDVGEGVAGLALPTAIHLQRCTDVQRELEAALSTHFSRRIPLRLVLAPAGGAAVPEEEVPEEEMSIDPTELRDAPPGVTSPVDHVMQAFEGATVVEE
jgi:DNA polymerase III subunit gamma/tau